jgi:hypothetical protein
MKPASATPSPAERVGVEPPWWRRLQLLWRLHFGMPATVGLAVLVVCLPLLLNAWDERAESRAANRQLPLRGNPALSPSGDPAFARLEPTGAQLQVPGLPPIPTDGPGALVRPRASALMLEALPPSGQRGADLGYLVATARSTGLIVVQSDYGMETSRLPGLARLRVDLALRGTDAQLLQLLMKAHEQFPNLAVDSIEWFPAGPSAGRANIGIHLVQFYRASPN